MALREEDILQVERQYSQEELFEDWFWKPVQRYATTFLNSSEEVSSWRDFGRSLQIFQPFKRTSKR